MWHLLSSSHIASPIHQLLQLLFPNDTVVFEKFTDTIDAGDEGARKRRIAHGAQQLGIRAHVFR